MMCLLFSRTSPATIALQMMVHDHGSVTLKDAVGTGCALHCTCS